MGEQVTTPKDIVLNTPLSDSVEKLSLKFNFSATTPNAVILYNIMDGSGKVVERHEVAVTGADFTGLVAGIGTTLDTRAEGLIWAHIQANYTTQDKP